MPRNPSWSRDELILALDLYRRIGTTDNRNPEVIELSHLLNQLNTDLNHPDPERFRNPNGVAMKLANFARFDPNYQGRGLPRGGAMEAVIWEEFADDPVALAREVDAIHTRMEAALTEKRERRYWVFGADPERYRVMDAIRDLRVESWTIGRSRPRVGDRALIWKFKGRDRQRGVVALAEIISNPRNLPSRNPDYWLAADEAAAVKERVEMRCIVPPTLPLWLDEHPELLGELSVVRATGGAVFTVTPEQWETILQAVGGWPSESPEIREAQEVVAELAGRRRGQGFQPSTEDRQAVERYAMDLAVEHYGGLGWNVENVSARASYDLLCRRKGQPDLHVEVKGTTGDGSRVLLTRNEVLHSRQQYPNVALYIVSGIRSSDGPHGDIRVIEPWWIDDGVLSPLAYEYSVPDPAPISTRPES